PPRSPRHRVRRRDRHAGARGRGEVREVLAAAGRHGRQGARGRWFRGRWRPMSAALEVTATGDAADAVSTAVPGLVKSGFASKLFAQDATLWGPDAEAEASIRLSWVGLPRSSRPLVGEIEAIRGELEEAGLDHV